MAELRRRKRAVRIWNCIFFAFGYICEMGVLVGWDEDVEEWEEGEVLYLMA